MERLFKLLLTRGGAIVLASSLSTQQLVDARANGNTWTDGEGECFAWVHQTTARGGVGWLAKA